MDWAERIEWIKQTHQLAPSDFKIHHHDWMDIMKKIEAKFVVKLSPNQHFNHWEDNLKGPKTKIDLDCHHRQFFPNLFDKEVNYWFVLVIGPHPSDKHLLYDCKLAPIDLLLTYQPNRNFFIIDKKYQWLYYFQRGVDSNIRKVVAVGKNIQQNTLKAKLSGCA